MQAEAAYDELIRRSRDETLLASCSELLAWDEETYLPRAGVGHRAEQMALLAGLLHDRAADPHVGELLAAVEGPSPLQAPASPAAANCPELRRGYDRARRLPRGGGGVRARLRVAGRPAGHDHPPLLRHARPRRLPHRHALRPAPFRRRPFRRPARGRPRPLRAGA